MDPKEAVQAAIDWVLDNPDEFYGDEQPRFLDTLNRLEAKMDNE